MAMAGFISTKVGNKYLGDLAVLKPILDIRGIQIYNARLSTFFADDLKEKLSMNLLPIWMSCIQEVQVD